MGEPSYAVKWEGVGVVRAREDEKKTKFRVRRKRKNQIRSVRRHLRSKKGNHIALRSCNKHPYSCACSSSPTQPTTNTGEYTLRCIYEERGGGVALDTFFFIV